MAQTLVNLAQLLQDRGALDEDVADYRRALVIQLAAYGPDHTEVVATRVGLAGALRAHHLIAEALDQSTQALASDAATLAADDPQLTDALIEVGEDQLAAGHPAEAAVVLERAVALADKPAVDPATAAEARFALAQALPAHPADLVRARALAETARAGFAHAGAGKVEQAGVGWVAAHR